MAHIAQNLIELIGNTPLLELTGTAQELKLKARILAKLEYLNLFLRLVLYWIRKA